MARWNLPKFSALAAAQPLSLDKEPALPLSKPEIAVGCCCCLEGGGHWLKRVCSRSDHCPRFGCRLRSVYCNLQRRPMVPHYHCHYWQRNYQIWVLSCHCFAERSPLKKVREAGHRCELQTTGFEVAATGHRWFLPLKGGACSIASVLFWPECE